MQTIFEKTQKGQRAYSLPQDEEVFSHFFPPLSFLRKEDADLPEISELDLMRHFSQLARRNVGIDTLFYPLGSCTMKYNPRVNEWVAQLFGFTRTHPLAEDSFVQGNLQVIESLLLQLCEVTGMKGGSLLPNAGSQGEFVGLRMIRAYHHHRKDHGRYEVLVPDAAHGTNPASVALVGYKTVSLKTDGVGDIDIEDLRAKVSPKTAALMLTNPNTLGLFSPKIVEISKIIHEAGGLLYYDGANLNPILEVVRPGEMGFDVMHVNLHKTFSTPHGGGGPGSGPVLCGTKLLPYLPLPQVVKKAKRWKTLWQGKYSMGSIASFHGNFAIYLRAYVYILLHGRWGLRKIAEVATLNANYLRHALKKYFTSPFDRFCMHEFVMQADNYLSSGVRALDIAKRLLDYGVHAPTIYFPLIVKECMLIEPTESESKATLDRFIAIIQQIVEEIKTNPEIVKTAPHTLPVRRLDEVAAAKNPQLIEASQNK